MASKKIHLSRALLRKGWADDVLVTMDERGTVLSVTPGSKPGRATRLKGHAIPGIANVHSHAHQRAMVGLTERSGEGSDSFWTWREQMYGYALQMRPEELEAVAAQLYVEMLKSGFTAVGEFQYLHHQPDGSPYDEPAEMSLRCLSAADSAGIAITLLPTLYAYSGFGGQPAGEAQRRFLNDAGAFLDILATLHAACSARPTRRLGISPHSLRTVTLDLLQEVIAGLDALDPTAPIHMHVAEQRKEVEDCLQWSVGRPPVHYLLDQFELGPRWCVIHATHMTAAETKRLAKSGAIAGLCPTTEANLGDGTFNAVTYLEAEGRIAIGSDSHVTVGPAEELRQLEYSQRLQHRRRNLLAGGPHRSTGRTLLEAVLSGGAKALAQPIDGIEVGRRCDIVVLDENHPSLAGRSGDEALDTSIFSAGAAAVKDVVVAGQPVVRDRRHVREEKIVSAYRTAIEGLRSRQ